VKVLTTNTRIDPRITYRENKTEGILNYDADNAYPQRIMVFIDSSGQATRCVNLLSKFLIGGGFKDQAFWKALVNNEGLTNDRFVRYLAPDKSRFSGFAIHVNWNANYKIDNLHYVPFEHCRLSIPDDVEYSGKIAVYHDWARWKSSRVFKDKIKWVDIFNPDPAVIQAQVDAAKGWANYKGQILYYSCESYGMSLCYPKSPLDPVIEDVDSDSQAKIFKNRNLRNNFTATHIGKYKGSFATDQERELFAKSLILDNQGAENAAKIILLELGGQEDSFELQPMTTANLEKLYQYTEESVRDNIRRVMLIPAILLSDLIPGKLGTSQEIQDAVQYYNAVTNDDRREIEEVMAELFSYWKDPGINPTNDYSIIPLSTFMIDGSGQPVMPTPASIPQTQPIIP